MSSPRPNPRSAFAVLALGALVLGSSELGVAGLLPAIGADLRVSPGTAGLLVTAYAAAVAGAGPVLASAARRREPRRVLVWAVTAMAAGNAATGAAGWFPAAVAARALTGGAAALYAATALTVAGALVGPGQQGRAVAVVFGGVTVSSVLGVPACMLAGRAIGWRAVYLALAAAALLVALAVRRAVPSTGGAAPRHTIAALMRPRLVAMFAIGAAVTGGQYAVSTYLVVLAMRQAGLSAGAAAALLLCTGAAGTVGTAAGGWAADRHARRTVLACATGLAVALAAEPATAGSPAALCLVAVAWSVAHAAFSTAAQVCVTREAGAAGAMAAAVNISVFNIGIATGSALGGSALRAWGPPGPALAGTVLVVAGAAGAAALFAVARRRAG